jgi:ABC-type transporter Mla MlaB component
MAKIEVNKANNVLQLTISEEVTGGENFPSIDSDVNTIEINLDQLQSINSSGIKAWINWKEENLENHQNQVIVHNCPECFVEQLNILSGMIPAHSQIKSFKVPYYDEDDDEIVQITLVAGEHYKGSEVMVKDFIEQDGKKLEIDVDTEDYFNFLKNYSN